MKNLHNKLAKKKKGVLIPHDLLIELGNYVK